MITFNKLKELRTNVLKITQRQFADKIGMRQHQVSNWEKNNNVPCISTIGTINTVFAVEMEKAGMPPLNKYDFGVVDISEFEEA